MEITNLLARFQPIRERADSNDTGSRRNDRTEVRAGSGRDRVSLSPEAKRAASMAEDAVVRQRQLRVNEIKERVANGTYEVDSQLVAKTLLQKEPEFFIFGIAEGGEQPQV